MVRKIHQIVIVAVLVVKCLSLHAEETYHHDHGMLQHLVQANGTDPTVVKAHLDLIQNQLGLIEKSYKQVALMNDVQVVGNEGALVKCKNVSVEDQSNMKSSLQNIETDLWSAYFEIQQYMKQPNYSTNTADALAQQYQQLKQRKQSLQITKPTYCPQSSSSQPTQPVQPQPTSYADIATHKYTSNLNFNLNWTYGKVSQQQYQVNQFQFLLNNDVVQCPKDTPFAAGDKCVSCKDTEIFFLDTATCGSCPDGTKLDQESHQCAIQSIVKCSGNQVYNDKTKVCECPSGLPNFDGSSCVGCFIPNFWNSKTSKCEACSKGTYYSLANETCLPCPEQKNFISSLSSCHDECTLSKPYYNSQSCIACPQVFNPDTGKCQSCPSGLWFDPDRKVCTQPPKPLRKPINCGKGFVWNMQNGQCIKETQCSCPSNYVYNANKSKCECPSNIPYDTGLQCVECNDPKRWDSELRQCVEQTGIDAVPIAKVPVITITNATAPSAAVNTSSNATVNTTPTSTPVPSPTPKALPTCNHNQIWDTTFQRCTCPPQTPYKTQAGCITCAAPQQWSASQSRCVNPTASVSCPATQTFDSLTSRCICPPAQPFFNGQTCQSCYLPMYWNNLQKSCLYCPTNQYFNPLSRKCQFCPQTRPLLVNHVCQPCPQGTTFNKDRCEGVTCLGGSIYSVQKNDCVCGDVKKPFYNGRECVSCLAPNRWDLTSRSCVYGDTSGVFSPVSTTLLS